MPPHSATIGIGTPTLQTVQPRLLDAQQHGLGTNDDCEHADTDAELVLEVVAITRIEGVHHPTITELKHETHAHELGGLHVDGLSALADFPSLLLHALLRLCLLLYSLCERLRHTLALALRLTTDIANLVNILIRLVQENRRNNQSDSRNASSEIEGIIVVALSQHTTNRRTKDTRSSDCSLQICQIAVSVFRSGAISDKTISHFIRMTATLA